MTIVVAKALPRYVMREYIDFKVNNISPEYVSDSVKDLEELVRKFNALCVVSITDTLNTSVDVGAWFKHYKTYKFDDFDPVSKTSLSIESIQDRIISDAIAQDMVDFLVDFSNSSKKNSLLLVNCEMGVSRSGAVVTFARNIFNIPAQIHRKHNPWIRPNKHILQTLHTVYSRKE